MKHQRGIRAPVSTGANRMHSLLVLAGGLGIVAPPAGAQPLFDAPFMSFVAGSHPSAVAVADLDADAAPDLVVANRESGDVTVLLNRAGADFAAGTTIRAGEGPAAVVAADLNRDGKLDLVIANERSGTVTVALQTGGSQPATLEFGTTRYAAGHSPHALAVADWDRNGSLDLFVAGASGDSIGLLENNGDGTLRPDSVIITLSEALHSEAKRFRAIAATDMDGNGWVDVVATYGCSGSCLSPSDTLRVAVALGSASGFASPASYSIGGSDAFLPRGPAESIVIADFNGDAAPDLAVVNSSPRAVAVLLNRGVTRVGGARLLSLALAGRFAVGPGPAAIVAADLDATPDGKLDLAVLNSGGSTVSVLRGRGNGTFEPQVEQRSLGESRGLAVGDVDLDGRPDLVVAGGLRDVAVLQRSVAGEFGRVHETRLAARPATVVLGRFDGDAFLDAVTAGAEAGRVRTLAGNGNGAFPRALGSAAAAGVASIALGDVDRDGRTDVVVVGPESDSVLVLRGGANSSLERGEGVALGARSAPMAVAIGDLGRQGVLDLVVATRDSLAVLFGAAANNSGGPLRFRVARRVFVGHTPGTIVLDDLDRNGALDVVMAMTGSDNVCVLLNPDSTMLSGANPAPPLIAVATGVDPRAIAVADLDRDGILDLAVACRGGGGSATVLFGDGTGHFPNRMDLRTGARPGALVAADLDHDGRLDLAVANEGSNTVSVFRAVPSTAPALPRFVRSDFGTGDAPVAIAAGDVNLDGALDLVVANQRSASISVLLGRRVRSPADEIQFNTAAGSEQVRLDWTLSTAAVARVSGIMVERTEDPAGEFVTRTVSPLVPTPAMDFMDTEVTGGREYWYRLLLREHGGMLTIAGPVRVRVPAGAAHTFLAVPFEPPSGAPVRIRIGIEAAGIAARLAIYDVAGRRIWNTTPEWHDPGEHTVLWDRRAGNGARAPHGVYFVRLDAGGVIATRKFVLLHR